MSNALVIPEILANVFRYLPTSCLLKLTYVNKMWRSEARIKLYQKRSKIIYKLVDKSLYIDKDVKLYMDNVVKFCNTFDLNLKSELFSVRKQLEKRFNDMTIDSDRTSEEWKKIEKMYPNDEAKQEEIMEEKFIDAWDKLDIFEYRYLVGYSFIKDWQERIQITKEYNDLLEART